MGTDVKERILDAAFEMLSEPGMTLEKLKIRDIALRAGVGVGLINYHFQSKENLVLMCEHRMLADIRRICEEHITDNMNSGQKLLALCRATCDYLAGHANLSRLSILGDMERSGYTDDNTNELMKIYLPAVREFCKEDNEEDMRWKTHLLLHGMQTAFLRSESVKQRIKLDYYIQEQRYRIIFLILKQLFFDNTNWEEIANESL